MLVFVILGNPTPEALTSQRFPPVLAGHQPALPNGAGTGSVGIIYFGAHGTGHLIVTGVYTIAGIIVAIAGSIRYQRSAIASHHANGAQR